MKVEINDENRVRFEALYINQNVYREHRTPSESGILTPRILSRPPSKYTWLELKSISSISDEDKEAVGLEPYDQFDEKGWYERSTFDELFYYWSFEDIDYLRSKGYALPWMGLSVEEMVVAGWIKLAE